MAESIVSSGDHAKPPSSSRSQVSAGEAPRSQEPASLLPDEIVVIDKTEASEGLSVCD